jgi:hypothetical protein
MSFDFSGDGFTGDIPLFLPNGIAKCWRGMSVDGGWRIMVSPRRDFSKYSQKSF